MRKFLIAAASAIFFGVLITELHTRLWHDSELALLLLTTAVLFVSGLLNLRLAGATGRTPGNAPVRPAQPSAQRPAPGAAAALARTYAEQRPETKRVQTADMARGRPMPAGVIPGRRRGSESSRQPPVPTGPREQGTVKWFNRNKGFGFIIRESGDEVFVHQRSVRPVGEGEDRYRPTLLDGQAVSYVVVVRDKGPQAEDVVTIAQS